MGVLLVTAWWAWLTAPDPPVVADGIPEALADLRGQIAQLEVKVGTLTEDLSVLKRGRPGFPGKFFGV